uniref:Uncharacterized protein n=1 Tax=Anopheles farauti TaxID=69004 RepID=A0A182Q6K0_9DIPT
MSMVKSQLPDGFATIRTRGLTRSKSRAEQYAPTAANAANQMSGRRSTMIGVVPPVMVAKLKPSGGSGPLFECPNGMDSDHQHPEHQQQQQHQHHQHLHQQQQLRYKSSSATAIATPPPVPPRTSSERTVSDRSSSVETPEDVEVDCSDAGDVEEEQLPTGGQELQQQQQPPTGPFREDDDIYYTSSLTYETFKPLTKSAANLEMKVSGDTNNYLNLAQSSEYIESLAYDFSLPPLKSPQYINELNMMRTRALDVSSNNNGVMMEGKAAMPMLFAAPPSYSATIRSDSPPSYGKIRSSYRSTTPESLDNGSSNSSTYSHPLHHGSSSSGGTGTRFLYDVPPKTVVAVAPHSLQYRKSFNHSNSRTDIIYEEPKSLHRNGMSSDTDSSYDGGSSSGNGGGAANCYLKIHKNASAELLNFADISTHMLVGRPNGYIRRYATLGHPGKDLRYGQGGGGPGSDGGMGGMDEDEFGAGAKSTSSLNDQDLVKVDDDLLNYKIGCQTTLRSKPVIPWYELAIRKDHRQSCPAMKERKRSFTATSFGWRPAVPEDPEVSKTHVPSEIYLPFGEG